MPSTHVEQIAFSIQPGAIDIDAAWATLTWQWHDPFQSVFDRRSLNLGCRSCHNGSYQEVMLLVWQGAVRSQIGGCSVEDPPRGMPFPVLLRCRACEDPVYQGPLKTWGWIRGITKPQFDAESAVG